METAYAYYVELVTSGWTVTGVDKAWSIVRSSDSVRSGAFYF